jgi:hypothetical protein
VERFERFEKFEKFEKFVRRTPAEKSLKSFSKGTREKAP